MNGNSTGAGHARGRERIVRAANARANAAGGATGHERGAALVIALLLLLILTLLALSGINTATTELTMAGNEQYRRNAAQAAAAGIEAIGDLGAVPTSPGAAPVAVGPTALPDSASDRYATSTRFVGDELGLPQSSADKFIGLHYQIDSTGTSLRNASDLQSQGVMVVAASGSSGGGGEFTRIGGGLE